MALRSINMDTLNRENTAGGLLKQETKSVKTGRQALGDIKNRVGAVKNVSTRGAVKKQNSLKLKEEKPTKNLLRSKSTVSLVTVPENDKSEKVDCILMDISTSDDDNAFSSHLLPDNVKNIDAEDVDNPQLVSDYVNDIYNYLRDLEAQYSIKENHLGKQSQISGRMRSILVDWLVSVHQRFHLLQETLYLTIAILDRFLQESKVERCKLQLVGVTCMFIASKYEEMYAPEIGDFVYITDNAYTKKDILKMECLILRVLEFNLGRPLPLHFLRRDSKAGNADVMMHTLAKYLMELTLPEYHMAHISPSQLAAASLCLAMKLLDKAPWTETLTYFSNYNELQLKSVMKQLCILVLKVDSSKMQAVRLKYSSNKLMKISLIPELKSVLVKEMAGAFEKS
ncbi:G2/mitotic-specific cyclin-B-like [Limulus polyphemus]|uniref:G2/mitotic-specific cyclin-B-like n=1 Tax=Limulus polyphemus TaxID=6850 RepID=A0ABM1BE96_LIMPO|nr:G2/mitotic-specific cyclin-B-like [Limulus polyphemus]